MEIQNLYGDFNLDLENFLPDTDPGGQSARPPTICLAISYTKRHKLPAGMNQGLTPVENALLSEEEKQIRLRQRGLA